MISFQQEALFDIIHEIDDLLKMHYEEVACDQDRINLNPRWDHYRALEAVNAFIVYAARDEGKLIGYAGFFVSPHMQYQDTVVAINDVLFLHPAYRKGVCGMKFIRFCDAEIAKHAEKIVWSVKTRIDYSAILRRLGYREEEIVLTKMTKKEEPCL